MHAIKQKNILPYSKVKRVTQPKTLRKLLIPYKNKHKLPKATQMKLKLRQVHVILSKQNNNGKLL